MPIEKLTTFKKEVFKYSSPDGDSYEITLVENHENNAKSRSYISYEKCNEKGETTGSPVTVDWDMWKSVYEEIQRIKVPVPEERVRRTQVASEAMPTPVIVDRRGDGMSPESLNQDIEARMTRQATGGRVQESGGRVRVNPVSPEDII